MIHQLPPTATADADARQQTRAALEAMHAYFTATAQARPRQERQRLEREWLAAIRQMRTTVH